MQKTMGGFKAYIEEGQVIYLEDIREGNPRRLHAGGKRLPTR